VSDPGVNLVAWTTTPWTLPSNLALCLNPDFEYLRLRQKKDNLVLIVASCRIKSLYKLEDEYEVLQRHQGRVRKQLFILNDKIQNN
jgi:isoleucyl-tRNA synthetase